MVIQEGNQGDRFLTIADGNVEIRRGRQAIVMLGQGAGIRVIALLREGVRTATVVASTPVSAFALDRVPFLTAVNGMHLPERARRRSCASCVGEICVSVFELDESDPK